MQPCPLVQHPLSAQPTGRLERAGIAVCLVALLGAAAVARAGDQPAPQAADAPAVDASVVVLPVVLPPKKDGASEVTFGVGKQAGTVLQGWVLDSLKRLHAFHAAEAADAPGAAAGGPFELRITLVLVKREYDDRPGMETGSPLTISLKAKAEWLVGPKLVHSAVLDENRSAMLPNGMTRAAVSSIWQDLADEMGRDAFADALQGHVFGSRSVDPSWADH